MSFKKLKVARILGGALGLLLVLSLVLVPSPVLAAPPQPHQFYGTVSIDGELAPEGTIVSAQIDGFEYASATVDAQGRYGWDPLFQVPTDDPDTPEVKEGGVAGETVEFYIGVIKAYLYDVEVGEWLEGYPFEIWGITELNLETTIDIIAPTVVGTTPEDGATNEAIDVVVSATFSEDVTAVDLSGITIAGATGVSAILDEATDTITIAHEDFAYETTYEVTIPAGAVEDLAGLPLAEAKVWSFITEAAIDIIPPTVVGTTPEDGATNEAIDVVVSATFDEAINEATLVFTLDTVAGTVAYDSATKMATFTPAANLDYEVTYTASVQASDLAGNPMAVAHTWSFTTVTTITFTITATAGAGGTISPSGDVVVNYGASQAFTITADTGYEIADVLIDGVSIPPPLPPYQMGVLFKNVTADRTIHVSFAADTTAPTVVSRTPGAGAIDVAVDVVVSATFDEAIDPATLVFTLDTVVGTVAYNGATKTATFTPAANLDYEVTYTASVQASDLAGNPMAVPDTWSFTTRAEGPISFIIPLSAGWNLLSTPILLDVDSDALEQILGESLANIEASWRWDAQNQQWAVPTGYELSPLEAVYLKVRSGASATAEFIPSGELSELPSRELQRGLNLIGPAPALGESGFPDMPLDEALASIEDAEGGLKGYFMVVSPLHNQPGWTYALGGQIQYLLPFKGYWVVMENADTLYGFSTTPLP